MKTLIFFLALFFSVTFISYLVTDTLIFIANIIKTSAYKTPFTSSDMYKKVMGLIAMLLWTLFYWYSN